MFRFLNELIKMLSEKVIFELISLSIGHSIFAGPTQFSANT